MAVKENTLDRKIVQFLLRLGLLGSVVLMASGLLLNAQMDALQTQGIAMREVFTDRLSLGDRLLTLGVLVLVSTPVIRVMALIVLWIRERDWKFVLVSLGVFITLAVSILLGGH